MFALATTLETCSLSRKLLAIKLRKAFIKPDDWQRHIKVLEKLAAPKIVRRRKKLVRKYFLLQLIS